MTVDLRHLRVSGQPDDGDPTVVQGPDWDAAHRLRQGPAALLGRSDTTAGQADTGEIALDPATMQFVAGKLGAIIPSGGGAPTGAAGGDLAGTYPNPTIKADVALAGNPTAATQLAADNSARLATTAFIKALGYQTVAGMPSSLPPSGAASGDLAGTYPAPTIKASVALGGVPTAATASPGTNTLQLATTAFVAAAVAAAVGGSTPTGPAGGDLSGTYPNPTIKAGVALGGVPTAATAAPGTSTTQLSTTAFVAAAIAALTTLPPSGAAGGALAGTYPNPTLVGGPLTLYAPLASPVFTGDPQAPQAAAGDNDNSIASTAWVQNELLSIAPGGASITGYWLYNGSSLVPPPASAHFRLSVAWPPTLAASIHIYISSTDNDGFTYTWALGPTVGSLLVVRSASNGRMTLLVTAVSIQSGYIDVTCTVQSITGLNANNSRNQLSVLPQTAPPTGNAGGDLNGTYPNPTLAWISRTAAQTLGIGAGGTLGSNAFTSTAFAPLASPVLTGDPQAPTPATADNDTSIATTAFVKAQGYQTIAGMPAALPPNGAAGGDLAGTYPNPTVAARVLVRDTTNTISKGFTYTPNNLGTVSSGTTTLDGTLGNYQYMTNNGASTIAAPAADTAISLMITNGASAGALTFTGFTVGSGIGDALTTTNAAKFLISIVRVNAISTYVIKALQ